jgi:hypothetical protein
MYNYNAQRVAAALVDLHWGTLIWIALLDGGRRRRRFGHGFLLLSAAAALSTGPVLAILSPPFHLASAVAPSFFFLGGHLDRCLRRPVLIMMG